MKGIYLTSAFTKKVAERVYSEIGLPNPKTAFIYTAAEEKYLESDWFLEYKNSLSEVGFDIEPYTISGKDPEQIKEFLSDKDVIYVTGGNTFFLKEKSIESGFETVLEDVLKDTIYIGQSAGSVLLGTSIALKANPPETTLQNFDGFGVVNFTIIPHWGAANALERKKELFDDMYKLGENILLLNNESYLYTDGDGCEIRKVSRQ